MAVPEPVRRGAGVVNWKSKPFDLLQELGPLAAQQWGGGDPTAFLCPIHAFTCTSHCHSHKCERDKSMCEMREDADG